MVEIQNAPAKFLITYIIILQYDFKKVMQAKEYLFFFFFLSGLQRKFAKIPILVLSCLSLPACLHPTN